MHNGAIVISKGAKMLPILSTCGSSPRMPTIKQTFGHHNMIPKFNLLSAYVKYSVYHEFFPRVPLLHHPQRNKLGKINSSLSELAYSI